MDRSVKKAASIRTQVIVRFSIVFAVLICSFALFIASISKITHAQSSDRKDSDTRFLFMQAMSDHYRWANQLTGSIAFGAEFEGATEPTSCNFGKFIYGEAIQNDPRWSSFLEQVEPLHKQIHENASRILALTNEDAIYNLYSLEIEPALSSLVSILNDEAERLDAAITEGEQSEDEAVVNLRVTVIVQMLIVFFLLLRAFIYVEVHIAEPIIKLRKKCVTLAEGDLSTNFDVPCNNYDIQCLSHSLNIAVGEIKGYVDDIDRAMGEISQRNLNVSPGQPFIGDFQPIERSIGRMLVDLTNAIQQIDSAAQQVSLGSDQVADGAQALAHGSAEQASSVEELSATVSEVSNQISNNAVNAAKAGAMAQETSDAITASNEQMKELMESIHEINTRSEQIGNIIKTIEDIAFQTNILALNAAVEAARAGNAGKGFAVVAGEVRSLAGKSAEAAQNTTDLIRASIQAIRKGVSLAQSTATEMERVVGSANQTSAVIAEIAHATQEQANALDQINMGLEHISAVVQANSATSEESAAASEELSSQATQLRSLIASFHLLQKAPANLSHPAQRKDS
jgi:methyl-accepting chemotaxis protein